MVDLTVFASQGNYRRPDSLGVGPEIQVYQQMGGLLNHSDGRHKCIYQDMGT